MNKMNSLCMTVFVLLVVSFSANAIQIIEVDNAYYIEVKDSYIPSDVARAEGFEEHFDSTYQGSTKSLIYGGLPESYTLTTNKSGAEPVRVDIGVGSNVSNDKNLLHFQANGAAKMDLRSAYNSTLEVKNLKSLLTFDGTVSKEVFVSYYVYIDHLSGDKTRNLKLLRLSSGYDGAYQSPMFGITLFPSNNNAAAYNYHGSEPHNTIWFDMPPVGKWLRFDYYLKHSSIAGASDGTMEIYLDGEKVGGIYNDITYNTTKNFEWMTLPYYVAHDPGGEYQLLVDSVVVTPGYERIEACIVKEFPDDLSYSKCESPLALNGKKVKIPGRNAVGFTHPMLVSENSTKMILYYFGADNKLIGNPVVFCPLCPKYEI